LISAKEYLRQRLDGIFPAILAVAGTLFLLPRMSTPDPANGQKLVGALGVAILAGFLAGPVFRSASRSRAGAFREALRWVVLLAAGLALTFPYTHPERVGAGDAQDYAQQIADFLSQVRAGVFPVFVGQSGYAFNGAFNPLRTAPYLQYSSGILNVLSFGMLGPYALLNLEIVLSLIGAGFSSYLCLRRLLPECAWICVFLALLYVTSPGVLALAYGGDMVLSWLTLPYLPLCAYLTARIAEEGMDTGRMVSLAATMAALWLAHAPIAMWASVIVLAVLAYRCAAFARRTARLEWRGLAMGSILFSALAGYVFVSVHELHLPPIPGCVRSFHDGGVLAILREGWRGFLRPVSADGAHLTSDLQLSPGLWICLVIGALGWPKAGAGARALLLGSLFLLLLLLPIPAVAGRLWDLFPGGMLRITDLWPMQRFYPILSAFAPMALAFAWRKKWPLSLPARDILFLVLGASCAWSAFAAEPFIGRGQRVTLSTDASRKLILEKNAVLSVYSSAMLQELPDEFSRGAMDPEFELRLLNPANFKVLQEDGTAILDRASTPLRFDFHPTWQGAEISAPLRLAHGRYILNFKFGAPIPAGTLVIESDSNYSEYPLPTSGGRGAFGSAFESSPNIAIAIDGGAETLRARFDAAQSPSIPIENFSAEVRVIPVLDSSMPLRLKSLIPYRVETDSKQGALLETSRLFISGYRAQVNGKPAPVVRSNDGLAMVPIPAGRSEVVLTYPGTLLLRIAFWITAVSWALLPVSLYVSALVSRHRREAASLDHLFQAARRATRKIFLTRHRSLRTTRAEREPELLERR
jgi:hypothetical protein